MKILGKIAETHYVPLVSRKKFHDNSVNFDIETGNKMSKKGPFLLRMSPGGVLTHKNNDAGRVL